MDRRIAALLVAATTLTVVAQAVAHHQHPEPSYDAGGRVQFQAMWGGYLHPVDDEGRPFSRTCTDPAEDDETCPTVVREASLITGSCKDRVVDPCEDNDLAELRMMTVVEEGSKAIRGSWRRITKVCENGFTPRLDGCAIKDGIYPVMRFHRPALDARLVHLDVAARSLSIETRRGLYVLALDRKATAHMKEGLSRHPSVLVIDVDATAPRRGPRGLTSKVVRERRPLSEQDPARPGPSGPKPDPMAPPPVSW